MELVDYYFTMSIQHEPNQARLYVQFYDKDVPNKPRGEAHVEHVNLFCMTWMDVAEWIMEAALARGFDLVIDRTPSPFVHLR